MITTKNKFSNKLIFNSSDNFRNDNFQIISEGDHNSSETSSTYFKFNKEKNTIRKIFNSRCIVEIKNFKYIKQSNYSSTGLNLLDYILFNNGDFCSLDSSYFYTTKNLHFICNISSIINVNEIIQIEPYYSYNNALSKNTVTSDWNEFTSDWNEFFRINNAILAGFFILDINHKLFKLENKSIILLSLYVNVFEIYNVVSFCNDYTIFFISFIKNNKTIVALEYNIFNHGGIIYSKESNEFTKTLNNIIIIDINLHQIQISYKCSNGTKNNIDLHHKTGFNITHAILYRPYNKNKYYNEKLTLKNWIVINKSIILQFIICFSKKFNIYPPILIMELIFSYLSINAFEKVVSFLDN